MREIYTFHDDRFGTRFSILQTRTHSKSNLGTKPNGKPITTSYAGTIIGARPDVTNIQEANVAGVTCQMESADIPSTKSLKNNEIDRFFQNLQNLTFYNFLRR